MKNKKSIVLMTAVLALALVVAGTFAWFSSTDSIENVMSMDTFDVTLTEAFDPDVPINPGSNITKDVKISNHGNMAVVVRVRFEEALSLLTMDSAKNKPEVTFTASASADAGQIPVKISDEMIAAYIAAGYAEYNTNAPPGISILSKTTTAANGNPVYTYMGYVTNTKQIVNLVLQGDDKSAPTGFTVTYGYHTEKPTALTGIIHGKTGEDVKLDTYLGPTFHDSVELIFYNNVQTDGQALEASTTWYLCDDGYFYYTKKLEGNSFSEGLLASVDMKPAMANDMQGATYKLTPVMEAVQLNHEAVKAIWADLATNYPSVSGTVTANNAKQLVYNIIKTDKAYQ